MARIFALAGALLVTLFAPRIALADISSEDREKICNLPVVKQQVMGDIAAHFITQLVLPKKDLNDFGRVLAEKIRRKEVLLNNVQVMNAQVPADEKVNCTATLWSSPTSAERAKMSAIRKSPNWNRIKNSIIGRAIFDRKNDRLSKFNGAASLNFDAYVPINYSVTIAPDGPHAGVWSEDDREIKLLAIPVALELISP